MKLQGLRRLINKRATNTQVKLARDAGSDCSKSHMPLCMVFLDMDQHRHVGSRGFLFYYPLVFFLGVCNANNWQENIG
jgi:hypothetical protein